jgi:hypothetical protein
VLAAADRPAPAAPAEVLAGRTRVLVLEGVSDNENVGALFRNAAALGIDAVLLDPACTDPLYRRSIRVSSGWTLRVPFARGADSADLLGSMGDDIDRSHAEELLAVASHNDELAQRHLPGIYFGDILAVSSMGTDSGSAWHPFVCGTIAKYLVPDATSFDVVGPLVDSYLS